MCCRVIEQAGCYLSAVRPIVLAKGLFHELFCTHDQSYSEMSHFNAGGWEGLIISYIKVPMAESCRSKLFQCADVLPLHFFNVS